MPKEPPVWDTIFEQEGLVFPDPHEDMPHLAQMLEERQARTVLDVGCGTGRHVLYLAQRGFRVSGVDNAPTALTVTQRRLQEAGLTADLRLHDIFDTLPFPNAAFDALVSTQVIHHARIAQIRGLVAEMVRILKPNGLVFVTVPQVQNQATQFQPIEPGTFLPLDGREAGLPHHYFTPEELRDVFQQFEVIDFHVDRDQHSCLTAIKR